MTEISLHAYSDMWKKDVIETRPVFNVIDLKAAWPILHILFQNTCREDQQHNGGKLH